jgi:CTP:molybdopterin cytidylyltransferase MocA
MEHVAAIVLAAGFSSRLPAFKPLVEIEGRTFLERAVGAFAEVGISDVLVVTGHRGEEVAAAAGTAGARSVPNPLYEEGMYTSVRAGVAALPASTRRFFVLPVDCALVRPETVGLIARASRTAGADVLYPEHNGHRGHPPLMAAALKQEILGGEPPGGLRGLLESHAPRAASVAVPDPGVLFDADTPNDLQRARDLAGANALPSEARCAQILAERQVPHAVAAHSRAVAAVALALAAALNERGQYLCLQLLTAAALLHDVARDEPDHADAGAALVDSLGYSRVAAVVRRHMDLGTGDSEDVDEAGVLYLADKLVLGARAVSLEERFAPRLREFSGDPAALAAARARLAAAESVRSRVEEVLGRRLGPVGGDG